MPKSILEMIYKGKILTWEERSIITEKIRELNTRIEFEHKYFTENMNENQQEHFDEFLSLLNERTCEEYGSSQYNNFILGILVGIDICEHREEII